MSSRLTRDDARALALQILREKPDPAVRVRLLRDSLRASASDTRLEEARAALEDSAHVAALRAEQAKDGSWGRLHSREAAARQAVPTTEWAVERAWALGLDRNHPILEAAAAYLADVATGKTAPSDPPEKNDRWPVGVRLFAAATLARIAPDDPAVDGVWELWHEVARRAFVDGAYNEEQEEAALAELTGAAARGTYLVLSSRYALALLASRADRLDHGLEQALVRWIWGRPEGIGSFGVPLSTPPEAASAGALERFLLSHEIAAGFDSSGAPTGPLADWLERHRRSDGLWDLGQRASWTAALPLSESWRRGNARSVDWTARILGLLLEWQT